jgi:hypothetical protein
MIRAELEREMRGDSARSKARLFSERVASRSPEIRSICGDLVHCLVAVCGLLRFLCFGGSSFIGLLTGFVWPLPASCSVRKRVEQVCYPQLQGLLLSQNR